MSKLLKKTVLFNPVSITAFILVIVSFLDSVLASIYLNTYQGRLSSFTTGLFVSFIIIYGISIFIILRSIRSSKLVETSQTEFKFLLIYFSIVFFLFSIIISQVVTKGFSLYLFEIIVFTCYISSIVIFFFLFKKLLSWFKLTKNLFILSYLIAIVSFILTESFILAKMVIESINDPLFITPIRNPWTSYSSTDYIFSNLVTISISLSFIILWFATIVFIRNYSSSFQKYLYILLIVLPLIYFLGPMDSNYFHILSNSGLFDRYSLYLINTFVFGGVKQIGGIFFAIAFFILINKLTNSKLNYHLTLAGTGIILFFSSVQSSLLIMIPFPPFSLGLSSIVVLASFLIYLSFYNIATVSRNEVIAEVIKSVLSEHQKQFFKDISNSELDNIVNYLNSKFNTLAPEVRYKYEELDDGEIKKILATIMEEKEKDNNFRR